MNDSSTSSTSLSQSVPSEVIPTSIDLSASTHELVTPDLSSSTPTILVPETGVDSNLSEDLEEKKKMMLKKKKSRRLYFIRNRDIINRSMFFSGNVKDLPDLSASPPPPAAGDMNYSPTSSIQPVKTQETTIEKKKDNILVMNGKINLRISMILIN